MLAGRVCVCVAALVCVLTATSVSAAEWTPTAAGLQGYSNTPVWSDEFSGDLSKWTAEDRVWPHNGELQFYSPEPDYVRTEGGLLKITATNDRTGSRDYTSARISTKHTATFKHGVFAARIKFTQGQGIWPAFWMFGTGPKYSEFDIAEGAGGTSASTKTGYGDDSAMASLFHYAMEPGGPVTRSSNVNTHHARPGTKFADDFYVFWLEWTPTRVQTGMDTSDKQVLVDDVSKLDAFQAQMYLILNVAIGGSYPGHPDATTRFPQQMQVDWVRVYSKNGERVVFEGLSAAATTAAPNWLPLALAALATLALLRR